MYDYENREETDVTVGNVIDILIHTKAMAHKNGFIAILRWI